MKNLENVKVLNEVEMNAVTGGNDDRTVVDSFVDGLLDPIIEFLGQIADAMEESTKESKAPMAPMAPHAPARPLPFPQNRG